MPIICQLCQREFSRQITNSHLRSHGTTTDAYRARYGIDSLTCAIYKSQLSESRIGDKNANFGKKWTADQKQQASDKINAAYESGQRSAWNKGLKVSDAETLESIRQGVQKREAKYANGELTRAQVNHSAETRELLSQRQQTYAAQNAHEMSQRAHKALATKSARGQDLAFFRGKKHTEATKSQLRMMREQSNLAKTQKMQDSIHERAQSDNLQVINFENLRVNLKCLHCQSEFSFHRQIFTESKWHTNLCFTCYPRHYKVSVAEQEIADFIQSLSVSIIRNYRSGYHGLELDIYVPDKKIGFEYNGLYWHSESCLLYSGYSPTRDNDKRQYFSERDIRVIQIFEDEWLNKSDHVKSRIRNSLGCNLYKIGARSCTVQVINSRTLNGFLNKHHIMSSGRSNIGLGLYQDSELVSVMSFTHSNPSRRFSGTTQAWELDRFCSKLNTTVMGAAQKLFKYFINHYDPQSVLSYSDNRWNTGSVYAALGFEKINDGQPNYWYFKPNELVRYHRYTMRKTSSDILELSEYENRTAQGYLRIWDCGSSKWLWTKK